FRLAPTLLLARTPLFFFAFGQLLFCLGALLRGLFFCFPFQSRLGLSDLLQPAFAPLRHERQFVALPIPAVLGVLLGISLFGGPQQHIDLLLHARLGLV